MEAYDLDLIQVLWVEDDPKAIETYPIEAESKGLQLKQFSCWDDAKVALEDDYDRWSAIILDAKCKHHRDSADNAVKFLGEALKDIAVKSKEKRRVIPWYVLTAGDESEVSNSINEDREEWDSDWTVIKKRNFYTKSTDRKDLYERILEHAKISPRLQIKEMYRDSYKALYNLNKKASEIIINVFEAMHYPGDHPDFNPVLYYNQLRQILEWNFRNANKYAIIPDECIVDNKVNLNQCCCYLCGKNATATKVPFRYGEYRNKNDFDRIVPQYIENMMFLILNIGNIYSHTPVLTEEEQQKLEVNINNSVMNSRYLIFSLALQVCEITLWMYKYVGEHQDIERNKAMFRTIDNLEQESDNREPKKQVPKGNDTPIQESSGITEEASPLQYKKLENGNYYEGVIVEVYNQLKVKCDLYRYTLMIKSQKDDISKDDKVVFKAGQEPNNKNPNKIFWYADDVSLKK